LATSSSVGAPAPPRTADARPARRGFPWFQASVLGLVGLLLIGLIGEIAVRLADLRTTQLSHPECLGAQAILNGQKGLFLIDPQAGYRMRPNACVLLRSQEYDQVLLTNNHGFVGPDLPAAKPAGEFRVVVLGDSYTVAGQVAYAQDYTTRLEQQLHAAGYGRVRVVNAGVGGYTTFNEAGLLREDLAALQPDLVVVAAFVGNDVAENVLATYGGYRDAPEHPDGVTWSQAAADLLNQSDGWFPRNPPRPAGVASQPSAASRARSSLSGMWDQARAASRLLGSLFGDPIHAAGVTTAPGGAPPARDQRRLNLASFEWTILRQVPSEEHLDAAWPLFGKYLRDIRDTAASVGAPTVVFAIPEMAQFDDQMRARVMADYRFSDSEVDWDQPQRLLAQQTTQLGLPELDLLPVFRARPDRAELYLRLDTHFTALGHAATADALTEFLRPYVGSASQ
jgi:lysophospholipase L1-like esterase